jgi:L-arabinose isomerase
MKNLEAAEIWYVTGSQHLYGEQALRQVAADID